MSRRQVSETQAPAGEHQPGQPGEPFQRRRDELNDAQGEIKPAQAGEQRQVLPAGGEGIVVGKAEADEVGEG